MNQTNQKENSISVLFYEIIIIIPLLLTSAIQPVDTPRGSTTGAVSLSLSERLLPHCCLILPPVVVKMRGEMADHLLGLLRVRVQRGVNLAVRDFTSSDPYVILRMGNQVRSSSSSSFFSLASPFLSASLDA